MIRKALDWLENYYRKNFRKGLLSRKKQSRVLIKLVWTRRIRFLMKFAFYYMLIFGPFLIFKIMELPEDNALPTWMFVVLLLGIIITIIAYESIIDNMNNSIERFRKKAFKQYGPDFNKPYISKKKK